MGGSSANGMAMPDLMQFLTRRFGQGPGMGSPTFTDTVPGMASPGMQAQQNAMKPPTPAPMPSATPPVNPLFRGLPPNLTQGLRRPVSKDFYMGQLGVPQGMTARDVNRPTYQEYAKSIDPKWQRPIRHAGVRGGQNH